MEQVELRIHYGAPSLVKDDVRWQRLARNVASFRVSRKMSISNETHVGYAVQKVKSTRDDQSITSTELLSSGHSTANAQPGSRHVQHAEDLPSLTETSNKRKIVIETTANVHNGKRNKRTSFARAQKGLNPAFKIPIANLLKTGKQTDLTPVPQRPNTAPEATVLVPFTTTPKARRSNSDTTTASHLQADVSLSDLLPTSRVYDTSFESQECLDVGPIAVADDDHRDTIELETQLLERELTVALSQTPLRESDIETGTCDLNVEDNILHKQNINQQATPSILHYSTPSTETPSQPDRYIINSSPLAHRSTQAASSVIDLTSETAEIDKEVTRRDILGSISSPVHSVHSFSPATSPTISTKEIKHKIKSLPERIYSSGPTNSQHSFKSFVPQSLRKLADMFDLINRFRPVEAVKSIQNVHRGYWKMLIQITSLATVAKSRRSPLSASQWSDERFMLIQKGQSSTASSVTNVEDTMQHMHYPEKSPDTFTPWTLEEFTDFWTLMNKTIERGRAGYDVHATITDNIREREDGLELEVRFYGYGEALSHMWCVLYVQSNKAVGYMPMQWMGTGRGPLIRMSGQPKRGGNIGRWIELKPGTDGSWGLEEAWEGIASAS